MNLQSFAPLAGSLIRKGAPTIAAVVTMALTPEIGPFAGLVGGGVGDILPRIADAMGAPPDSTPQQLADTIESDPQAEQKLSGLEEEHASALAMRKQEDDTAIAMQAQQTALDAVEATSSSWFVSGWRPALSWALGAIVMMSYILPYPVWALSQLGIHLTTPPELNPQAGLMLCGLLGFQIASRSYDKSKAVAAISPRPRK